MDCEKCDVLMESGAMCSRLIRPEKTGVEIDFCPLHATALELLEACKKLVATIRDIYDWASPIDLACTEVRAAIAKAEGGKE